LRGNRDKTSSYHSRKALEKQVIAERFGVGQGRVSQVWAGFRDRVQAVRGGEAAEA